MSDWKKGLLSGVLLSAFVGGVGCGDDTTTGDNFVTEADGAVVHTGGGSSVDAGADARAKIDASHVIITTGNGGGDGDDAGSDDEPQCGNLMAHIRDFSSRQGNSNSNPDFETYS